MDTLRSLFTSDIAWHSPGQGAGEFHGVDAVLAEFGRLHHRATALSASRWMKSPKATRASSSWPRRRLRAALDGKYAHVFNFRGDQICESWVLNVDPAATAAFWA